MQYILPFLAALGLMLVAIVSVNGQSQTASGQNNVAIQISNAINMARTIQSAYSVGGSFATLTTAVAITDHYAPSTMINGTSISNGWGGTVTPQVDASTDSEFDEVWTNVPESQCAQFASGVNNAAYVSINGGEQLSTPVDPATASADCQTGSNTVTFGFSQSS